MMVPDESPAGSEPDECRDPIEAAQSALGFWDNPVDAADWNEMSTDGDG